MKLACALFALIGAAAQAQPVSPVDVVTTESFRTAVLSGDDHALEALLSPKVIVNVTQQMGPNGPNRSVPEGKGKAATMAQYHAVLAAVGKPSNIECAAADGVSVFCQFSFDQPGRGMQSMLMFDGKLIGALMIKYGGAAL